MQSVIVAIGWIFGAAALAVIVSVDARHRLWLRRGRELDRRFNALLHERETEVDALVMDVRVPDEHKQARVYSILKRFEDHARMRAEWARDGERL